MSVASRYNSGHRSSGKIDQFSYILALTAGLFIVAWAVVIFVVPEARFASYSPRAAVGVEAAAALARLFAALVLSLFPPDARGRRLHWVAAGFGVLGLGGIIFGLLVPVVSAAPDPETSIYAILFVRTLAGVLFMIGLVPAKVFPFNYRSLITVLLVFAGFSLPIVFDRIPLPLMTEAVDLRSAVTSGKIPLQGLTRLHHILSLIPLGLGVAAIWGSARHIYYGTVSRWLLIAMVVFAGSQLHSLFWPSAYSPVVTTAELLRLLFAAVVVTGGLFELRRIAIEYAALLRVEQEHARRLGELARLKADFTAMVAHELSSPVATIRRYADVLGTGEMDPQMRGATIEAVQREIDLLTTLVTDVQASAQVEREEFSVRPRPVPLADLLADATTFFRTLPGHHSLTVFGTMDALVLADPERISQVLRNLLSNAVKYSAEGSPIELRVVSVDDRIRIEVIDQGPGLHPEDLERIFEKFGRGRDQHGQKVPGLGLGLYLSRRIVQAHGTELSVQSTPGQGSNFNFELEVLE